MTKSSRRLASCLRRHFSIRPSPNRTYAFWSIRLSGVLPFRVGRSRRASGMDIAVALLADDQRLALAGRHDLHPEGPLGSSFHLQILERSDVVDLDVLIRAQCVARISGVD